MKIEILKNSKPEQEQIYKEKSFSKYVFDSIKRILQNDKFGFFQLRLIEQISMKILKSDKEIKRLIQLKSKQKQTIPLLKNKLQTVKSKNEKMLNMIKGKIENYAN